MTVFHNVNNIRLEVEEAPVGLTNYVLNPDGALGAWFWLTPVANTTMSKSATGLLFTTTVSQACNFTTDFMPIAATHYAAARFDLTTISASHNVKVRYEWYNASKVLLSSGTQTGAISTAGTAYVPAAQAPANTAYVKLRFDFYNGAGNPSANATVNFTKAMVATNSTNTFSTTRTNLIPNPSFEVNTTGWELGYAASLVRSTAQASSGTASGLMTDGTTYTLSSIQTTTPTASVGIAVTGGQTYTFSVKSKAATTARTFYVVARWFNNATIISDSSSTGVMNSTSAWVTMSKTWTAPSNANKVQLHVIVVNTGASEQHYVDAALFELGSTVGTYFDGSSTSGGGKTYSWSGTAHNSASNEVNTNFEYAGPTVWQNILGPTHRITVTREALNVGNLNAEVLDALLDPAVADTIRPGKRIRLIADDGTGYRPVFNGTLNNAVVTYDKNKVTGLVKTRININASDALQTLTGYKESRGVATIAALPYLLEGKGVPWNVNGSGNQVGSATVVSTNDNASIVDQVAVTRDSALGYAWIDTNNVLQVHDASNVGVNRIPNPGFEVNTAGYVAGPNMTIGRTTAQAHTGTASMTFTAGMAGNFGAYAPDNAYANGYSILGGATYRATVWTKAATTARSVKLSLEWGDASGVGTGVGASTTITNTTSGWTQIVVTGTAPVDATTLIVAVSITGMANGEVHYFDDFYLENIVRYFTDQPYTATNYVSYTDIDVDLSTAECINHVTVKWLRLGPTGETEEVAYGPYTDASSIATWGVRPATFTIHGATENATTIQNYANAVLATMATPQVRCNNLRMPVRNAAEMRSALDIDLCSLVKVTYDDKVDDSMRVTGIVHNITPDSWMVDYNFASPNSVASPQEVPALPAAPINPAPCFYAERYVSASTASIANNTFTTVQGWTVADNNALYTGGISAGQATIDTDGTYIVNVAATFDTNTTGRRVVALFKGGAELARLETSSPGFWTGAVSYAGPLSIGDVLSIRVFQGSGAALALAASPGHRWEIVRLGPK